MVYTGGPRYMREIGTPKIGSHIMNSHIKNVEKLILETYKNT